MSITAIVTSDDKYRNRREKFFFFYISRGFKFFSAPGENSVGTKCPYNEIKPNLRRLIGNQRELTPFLRI